MSRVELDWVKLAIDQISEGKLTLAQEAKILRTMSQILSNAATDIDCINTEPQLVDAK